MAPCGAPFLNTKESRFKSQKSHHGMEYLQYKCQSEIVIRHSNRIPSFCSFGASGVIVGAMSPELINISPIRSLKTSSQKTLSATTLAQTLRDESVQLAVRPLRDLRGCILRL